MLLAPLRWIVRNISTILLSLILAAVVWVSAVVTADPNEQHTFRPVPLEKVGQDPDLLLIGDIPTQARLTLRAPQSIWNQLNNNPSLARAWVDLSGLDAGTHVVKVNERVDLSPVRYVQIEPSEITITLEKLVTRSLPVQLQVNGDPPLGYKKGNPTYTPAEVTVSGPESVVNRVAQLRTTISVAGASQTVKTTAAVEAVDENGYPVNEVTIVPKSVTVTQPVSLVSGYKNVVVKVVTTGQVANGYRLTNISVTPPNVTVASANPQLVNEIPGYMDTLPVDLNGLRDDIEVRTELKLPQGVTLVGEQSVLVQVGVAAIEGSLTVTLPVEMLGLTPDLKASISPSTVDMIIYGPLPVLDVLSPASFRVVVDLTGLGIGTYQLTPVVDLVPEQVEVQAILPESIEVTIAPAPTPTATPQPGANVPAATGTPQP